MDKTIFDNLPPDKKMEMLNKLLKGDEKLTDGMNMADLFPGFDDVMKKKV